MPIEAGLKRTSGQRKRSLPMVMTWPSGSSYDFSSAEDSAASCISSSKSRATYDELLLDVTDDLALGGRGEGVAALGQDLHQVVGQVAAGEVEAEDGVGKRVALVDGHGVGHTVARVQHDAGGTAGGVQGEHGLDGDVHGRGVEGLEHDLGHLLAVGLGVEGGLGEQDGVLLGGDAELVVEGVVPDLLHVVPVGHDAVLDGVLQGQDATLGLGLVADVRVLLAHADHDALVAGTANDGREDGAGGVVTGEASL